MNKSFNQNLNTNVKYYNDTNNIVSTLEANAPCNSPLFTLQYIQGILKEALGFYVICEFLIGTEQMVTREGYLSSVGINFFVMYDVKKGVYTLCDIYSLKFVNFTEYFDAQYIKRFEDEYEHLNSTTTK